MKCYSYFDGKTQFSQIFLGFLFYLFYFILLLLLFFLGGGGGGGGGCRVDKSPRLSPVLCTAAK